MGSGMRLWLEGKEQGGCSLNRLKELSHLLSLSVLSPALMWTPNGLLYFY